ncbi:MAG: phage tail tape measure protein, partial [Chloroflexus sp.]
MAPLYAILINAGLSGETVGTGFASILSSIQTYAYGLNKSARETRQSLAELGVSLNFLDDKGRAKGVEAIVAELEKLKQLAPEVRAATIRDIFGTGQDAQMVATIIEGGTEAYRKMAAQLANKARLQDKVNAQLGTLQNLWDAATGTMQNAAAAFAGALAPELKRATEWINTLAESLQGLIKNYPMLAKLIGGTLLFGGALAVAGGTVALITGAAMKAAGGLALMARWLGITRVLAAGGTFARIAAEIMHSGAPIKMVSWHLQTLAASAVASASAVGSRLVAALSAASRAVVLLGRAVLLNPIGLILGGAALLIYKYWQPIVGFFNGLWDGLKAGLAPLADSFSAAFAPVAPILRPIGDAIGRIIGFVRDLITPVEDAGNAAQAFGEKTGRAIAEVIALFLGLPNQLLGLPGTMLDIGQQIVAGLIDGITSKLSAASEAIKGLGQSVVSGLKNLLNIQSPSRVFAKLGEFVAQGFADGIGAGIDGVRKATAALSAAALIAAPAAPALAMPALPKAIRQVLEPVTLTSQIVVPSVPAMPALQQARPAPLPALRATNRNAIAASGMTITFAPVINIDGR